MRSPLVKLCTPYMTQKEKLNILLLSPFLLFFGRVFFSVRGEETKQNKKQGRMIMSGDPDPRGHPLFPDRLRRSNTDCPLGGRRCVRSPTPKGRGIQPQQRVMNTHQSQLEVFDVAMDTARDLNA